MEKRSYWVGLGTGILIMMFLAGCAAGVWLLVGTGRTQPVPGDANYSVDISEYNLDGTADILSDDEFVEKMAYVEDIIDFYYVEDVESATLQDGVIQGMMDSLGDKYADYYSPEELEELLESTQGVFYGIGAYISLDKETTYPMISGIMEGSPASEVDLCVNDLIVAVDGQDVYGMELGDAVDLIKGEENTTVTLTIARDGEEELIDIDVVRRAVEVETVSYEFFEEDKIAYIIITEFDDVTVEQFSEALEQANTDGMESLILDLRGNPGGNLTAVVDIANMLLPEGLVVYTEDKYGDREEYNCDGNNEIQVPMVVLVNGGSASAAEILTGAIKDYGKGTIMGTTTFGKGIVQRVIPIYDGSAVKLTVSHYYTPNGNDIHEVGIEPDVVVEFDVEAYLEQDKYDNQLEAAKDYLRN